ncbi:MAG: hypothetical protein P1P80_04080 [ANME-2 cluster archaeon]|nr:hypothetical protein [ANME-2 cluster archaeon]
MSLKYPESSSSFDLILAKGGSKRYKAFDIPVADEGDGGSEEINTVCPHCGDNLNINFNRAHTKKFRRIMTIVLVVFFSILYFPLMNSFYQFSPINTTTDLLYFFLFAGISALLLGGAFIIAWKIGFPLRTQGGKHNLYF